MVLQLLPQSSSRLKTPFLHLRILHSGQRQVSGTFSQGVPAGTPFFGSPLAGSYIQWHSRQTQRAFFSSVGIFPSTPGNKTYQSGIPCRHMNIFLGARPFALHTDPRSGQNCRAQRRATRRGSGIFPSSVKSRQKRAASGYPMPAARR